MKVPFWIFVLLSFSVSAAMACGRQAVNVKFQGTPFENEPFQIEGKRLIFYRGTSAEFSLSLNARSDRWCFNRPNAHGQQLAAGCFRISEGSKGSSFILRNPQGRADAKVKLFKRKLSATFFNERGRDTGKHIVVRDISDVQIESLDVHGYNCPNPKFLSCVGADLQTRREVSDSVPLAPGPLKEAELSTSLGHYRAACNGLRELQVKAIAERQ